MILPFLLFCILCNYPFIDQFFPPQSTMDYCGARFLWNLLGTFWYYENMDMLFELEEICHIFGGLLIEYLVDLPSSNKQVGIASAVTILAVFAINFVHLKRLTSISSNIRHKKFALLLILPLLLIIIGSSGAIFKVTAVEPEKPESVENRMSKITSIIGKVQTKVDAIDLAKWEWEDEDRLWLNFDNEIEASLSGLLGENDWEEIYEKEKKFREAAIKLTDKMTDYTQLLKYVDSISVACGTKEGLDSTNFELLINNTLKERNVSTLNSSLEDSSNTLKISMSHILKNRGQLEFVKRILQDRLNSMKNVLVSIRADVEQSESRKTEVHRRLIEKMPTMTYAVIIKAIVILTCSSFIILSSVGIVSIVFFGGTITSANRLDDSTDMTTFVTIIAGIILCFTSIGYYGTNECALRSNFGARDFLSPIVHQDAEIQICPRKDQTIFGFMEKEILPSSLISQNLGVEESKKKLFGLLEEWDTTLRGSTQLGDGLKNLGELRDKLDVLLSRDCIHLEDEKRKNIRHYLEIFEQFIDANSKLDNLVKKLIKTMQKKTKAISPIIHGSFAKISTSLGKSVGNLTRKVLSADASCKSIVHRFAETRGVICHPIENEIANYKTIIFSFLAGSIAAVILMIAVLRTYSYFFVDFGDEEDDSDSEWEE